MLDYVSRAYHIVQEQSRPVNSATGTIQIKSSLESALSASDVLPCLACSLLVDQIQFLHRSVTTWLLKRERKPSLSSLRSPLAPLVGMKPEQWRLDMYQDLMSFVPFNADLARSFVAIEMDPVPEEDARGYRRVEGWKVVYEGVIQKGTHVPSLFSFLQTMELSDKRVLSLEWTNFVGGLHGAAAAFLVDT